MYYNLKLFTEKMNFATIRIQTYNYKIKKDKL
jgi:hypothetical protein